uniref:Subtilisin n=1 Tax=Helicotheca tamesis TaxID=374047 RepID=A0A7S2DWL7_9STRA|mmetsp:Transcript_10475/g.14674  ORF Transcript_10475/g.14674 Transcript_10475/m.14674 type:complete len:114 (+) Transcript_10475:112-453(+)|eukprot:CAMPEP_0185732712 /NCGR_PEP_ID=MMETSP1171-20130828/17291_1 /TAXON_ID=374046 /ORGANISM="Helicotheca tamensis, Strain CCMP826" /LENGTH=113 /DNA_ID=CAMNT_0028402279 /DNA_START=35 /DNA_END=376 /DNA_ORIENTATION=+
MVSNTAIASIALLILGIAVAVVEYTSRGHPESTEMYQPMVGGSMKYLHEGPWPDCVGMMGTDCVTYIEAAAEDVQGHVTIVYPDETKDDDFDPVRVFVDVDEYGIVIAIPGRG